MTQDKGGWLHLRGLAQHHDPDPASDASSQDMYVGGHTAPILEGPGKGVAAQLNGSAQGQQLLHAMRALGSQLLAQATLWPSAAAAHAVLQSLQDAHSCVVALDDALDEQRISAGVAPQLDECRQWLRQAQGFVLALSKQVQGFADDEGLAAAASAEALSSMEEGCSTISAHGSSNGPSSAASLAAWRSTCGEAADALAAAVQQAAAGGAAEGAPSGGQASATRRAGSRLVAQTSRLSYATHWSQKVAI